MTDGTPTGETPGAGTPADPDTFRGLLALARTDPGFRRDLQAVLNPAGSSANPTRPGTGPLDDDLLNDEEEADDEDVQPDEDEEEEDEAEQLREELAATRIELNSLRIRQRNMDCALSSLAAQGRAITEQAEHEINDANRPLPISGRQPIAPRPAGRTAPRRGGMRPGPPPAAAGKKAGAAAAATAVKPGQYCHHCYSPDHLKPQCPWKHLPAKQAREQSGYSRPPAGANVPQKRSRPDDDDKGQGKGKLASANAK